jgi:hypothetical protein
MAVVVNNSVRAITIIDVLLTPGIQTEIKDEYLDHPGVQKLFKEVTEHNVPVLVIVEEKQPQEHELLAKAQ